MWFTVCVNYSIFFSNHLCCSVFAYSFYPFISVRSRVCLSLSSINLLMYDLYDSRNITVFFCFILFYIFCFCVRLLLSYDSYQRKHLRYETKQNKKNNIFKLLDADCTSILWKIDTNNFRRNFRKGFQSILYTYTHIHIHTYRMVIFYYFR